MAETRKQQKKGSRTKMGKIMSPVDITSSTMLNALDERIAAGPLTLVFVYADWCGHCQRFKPEMSKLESLSGRTIQTARVRDDVFPSSSLNKLPVDGYPSIMLVDTNGSAVQFKDETGSVSNTIPDYKNATLMNSIVKNAGKPQMINVIKDNTQQGISPETIASAPEATAATSASTAVTPYVENIGSATALPPSANTNRLVINNQQAIINTASGSKKSPISSNTEHSSQKLIGGGKGRAAKKGGSLLQFLKSAAYATGPAVGLLAVAAATTRRRSRTSGIKKRINKTRSRKGSRRS